MYGFDVHAVLQQHMENKIHVFIFSTKKYYQTTM